MSCKCADWKIGIIISSISVLFFLFLVETALRCMPGFNCNYKIHNPLINELNSSHWYPMVRPSSTLGYEMIPNSSPEVNSYGMAGREYNFTKQQGTYRTLVLGDSITHMDFYVRSLEQKLNSNPNLKYKFELWNAAIFGYQVNQYCNYLKFKGIKHNPDMVLIGFCLNDFNTPGSIVIYKNHSGVTGYYYVGRSLPKIVPVNNFLMKYSYAYRFIYATSDAILTKFTVKEDKDDRITTGRLHLKEIKKICLNNKIRLLGVVFPYLKPIEKYSKLEVQEYENMLNLLRELDIDFLDLHKAFPKESEKLESLRRWKNDFVHPSVQGHDIAAKAIYEYLINSYGFGAATGQGA